MVHNEIHTIDLLIIAAYLIAMVLIGLVVVRKVRNMDDYYPADRPVRNFIVADGAPVAGGICHYR